MVDSHEMNRFFLLINVLTFTISKAYCNVTTTIHCLL